MVNRACNWPYSYWGLYLTRLWNVVEPINCSLESRCPEVNSFFLVLKFLKFSLFLMFLFTGAGNHKRHTPQCGPPSGVEHNQIPVRNHLLLRHRQHNSPLGATSTDHQRAAPQVPALHCKRIPGALYIAWSTHGWLEVPGNPIWNHCNRVTLRYRSN